jgi:hypothetical protein
MNSSNAIDKSKKRMKTIFSSSKTNDGDQSKKIKWDMSKEYNIKFHDSTTSEQDIIFNSETFQGIEEYKYIELIWPPGEGTKLLFKVSKSNLDKIKGHISVHTIYNDVLKSQNENLNKSSVLVRPAAVADYYTDKTTVIFKEPFLSRKDLFQISQALVDTVIYPSRLIKLLPNPDNDGTPVGGCSNVKGVKPGYSLTGLVTSSTIIQMRSSSACLYFLVEISQDTFQFCINMKTKFEMIIELLKNTFLKLKESCTTHTVNVIFYTRVYFKKSKRFKKNAAVMNKNIYQSNYFKNEYFFDLYSSILKFSIAKMDLIEIVDELYTAFHKFSSLMTFTNLSDYLKNINTDYKTNIKDGKIFFI